MKSNSQFEGQGKRILETPRSPAFRFFPAYYIKEGDKKE